VNRYGSQTAIAFGNVVVQPDLRHVRINGAAAKLGARAFDVLVALIERRDRVVGKHELIDLVWPGLVVEENNLQVHISALRKLLGPQVIATIPGRGYRFTAFLEGDGGNFTLTAAEGGALRLETGETGLAIEGAEDFIELPRDQSDDKVFVLAPAPHSACEEATADVKE